MSDQVKATRISSRMKKVPVTKSANFCGKQIPK